MHFALTVIPAIILGLLASSDLRAQIEFEVASVKASPAGDRPATISVSPSGLYTATSMPLRILIRNAFGLQLDEQLAGGPDWVNAARFDISAKAENPRPSIEHRREMLQALLKERFKLVVHSETRQLPIYSLVVARADGSLGPQLTRPTVDCDALADRMLRGEVPPQPAAQPPLHGMRMQGGKLEISCMPLQMLISNLTSSVGRMVVDRTGLTGNFNLRLEWETRPVADGNRPSMFAAVQEQLGLKLEPARGPVEVVVIDHIERPAPD